MQDQRRVRMLARLRAARTAFYEDEGGDVPGWVLVTLMTAGLPVVTI